MKIKFDYITKDNVFKIVEIPENLSKVFILDKAKQKDNQRDYKFYISKEITLNKITVYNTQTNKFSEKSLYLDKKGNFYFKGNYYKSFTPISRKYYLNDLIKMEN